MFSLNVGCNKEPSRLKIDNLTSSGTSNKSRPFIWENPLLEYFSQVYLMNSIQFYPFFLVLQNHRQMQLNANPYYYFLILTFVLHKRVIYINHLVVYHFLKPLKIVMNTQNMKVKGALS